ncbi:DUF1559 family PulG-like putative transporter [Neorhodopirellula pilleata]|uniref:DUF1559 family PulG-like putative transporter n=1 Tax=Neorhodopirellula pilleata TaxID=2714738 RepID=UPI0018CF92F5|nr:DUF1559 domain-containing protein [Neorhodopirellula pilleata]
MVDPNHPDADPQSLRPHRKIGTWAVAILPWLDAQPTYEHWTEDRYPIVGGGTSENPLSTGVSGEGYSWLAAPNLAIMQCPSNPSSEATHGRNSYIVNTGVYLPPNAKTNEAVEIIQPSGQRVAITLTESMSPIFGIFHNQLPDTAGPDGEISPTGPPIRMSDITDGQGQTVLVSENVQAMPWHRAGFSDQDSLTIVKDQRVLYPSLSRFTNGMVWHDVDWDAGEEPQSVHQINGVSDPGNASADIFVVTMDPSNATDLARPSSAHADGVNCGMADGSTRFVSDSIDARVWQAMMTPAGQDSPSE